MRRHRPTRPVPATAAMLAACALLAAAPARTGSAAGGDPYPGYSSPIYSDPANWLCRPDKDDVCDHDLDATVVKRTGKVHVETFHPARRPQIDCFYVYPTISIDPGGNSDLVPGPTEELFVVRQQAARLGAVCRVFAPVYRQITLTALTGQLNGNPIPTDPALAYGDVLDAWKHYIANDNQGRGVILIGHSQGSAHLTRLLKQEIDPNPVLRDRLVSAMLAGTNFQVPVGQDVGGDVQNIPLCHTDRDTSCIISWATFRASSPPPPNSLFGRSTGPGLEAACTNPASLRGDVGTFHPYLPTDGRSLPLLPPHDIDWVDPSLGVTITTPFVTLPSWVEGGCVRYRGFHVLTITGLGTPQDPRIDDLTGADLTPEWGLHLVDVNLAMGDLVRIARSETRAYCNHHAC